MPLAYNTLVLVADGRKALFLRNHGNAQQVDLRVTADRDLQPRDEETAEEAEGRFARDLTDEINAMALTSKFDALVVVAPAPTMGELRSHWHAETAARIVGEHVQDMTGRRVAEIQAMLLEE